VFTAAARVSTARRYRTGTRDRNRIESHVTEIPRENAAGEARSLRLIARRAP